MEIQIKQADITDIDLLMKWRMETLHEVFSSELHSFPEDLEDRNRDYYEMALPRGKHIACFAVIDGNIVGCGGMCLYQEMPSPDNPTGQCAYLMNIYCRSPYRKQGVGTRIVCWLISQAKDRHITKIYLETSDAGRKLYEKLGFCDMDGMMLLK